MGTEVMHNFIKMESVGVSQEILITRFIKRHIILMVLKKYNQKISFFYFVQNKLKGNFVKDVAYFKFIFNYYLRIYFFLS